MSTHVPTISELFGTFPKNVTPHFRAIESDFLLAGPVISLFFLTKQFLQQGILVLAHSDFSFLP